MVYEFKVYEYNNLTIKELLLFVSHKLINFKLIYYLTNK